MGYVYTGTTSITDCFSGQTPVKQIYSGITLIWEKEPEPEYGEFLEFYAFDTSATVTLNKTGSPTATSLVWRKGESGTWQTYTVGQTLSVDADSSIQMKTSVSADNFSTGDHDYYYFTTTGNPEPAGDVMYLIDPKGERRTVPAYCFYMLFAGSDVAASGHLRLYSTTVGAHAYQGMFASCSNLEDGPQIEATTLGAYSLANMFEGCYRLYNGPSIYAESAAEGCCQRMFAGCSGLIEPARVDFTYLAPSCCQEMFYYCSSLTAFPELIQRTDLCTDCYDGMFKGCTTLKATTLSTYENSYLFLSVDPNTPTPASWSTNMLSGTTGDFTGNPVVGVGYYSYQPESPHGVIFTAVDDSATIALKKFGNPGDISLEYRIDGNDWSSYTVGDEFMLAQGQTIAFRSAGSTTFSNSYPNYYQFVTSLGWNVEGNLNDLIDTTGEVLSAPAYCFGFLLSGQTIYDASRLVLNAISIGQDTYQGMFENCTAMQYGPTTLCATSFTGEYNCYGMFRRCSFMRTAFTALPAETLTTNCYELLFDGCTSLVAAPKIHASTMGVRSCQSMFYNCYQLQKAPDLSATNLATACYDQMFYGCTNLTAAPVIATPNALCASCYGRMFKGCSQLSVTDNSAYAGAYEFMYAPTGTLTAIGWNSDTFLSTGGVYTSDPVLGNHYYCYNGPIPENPLKFTSKAADSSVCLSSIGSPTAVNLVYSTDGESWDTYTVGDTISLPTAGEYVMFKCASGTQGFSLSSNSYYQFVTTGDFKVDGNIQYLIDNSGARTDVTNYCFYKLFADCSAVTDAADLELAANTMGQYCYSYMFNNCVGITVAPALPAKNLALHCYDRMLRATGITTAPNLPATTLAQGCYEGIFAQCRSLTTPMTALPANPLAAGCYVHMFTGCSALTTAPQLPATTVASACYSNMFLDCSSLTAAPVINTTGLSAYCYNSMFARCSHLSIANVSTYGGAYKILQVASGTTSAANWNTNTFLSTGGVYKSNPEIGLAYYCYSGASDLSGLRFTALSANSTVQVTKSGSPSSVNLVYRKNGATTWTSYTVGNTLTLTNVGDWLEIRSNGSTTWGQSDSNLYKIVTTGGLKASGKLMYLVSTTGAGTTPASWMFASVFNNSYGLIDASELILPAGLGQYCYNNAFSGNTSLTKMPALYFTNTASYACSDMFAACSKLKVAAGTSKGGYRGLLVPSGTSAASNWSQTMFRSTGGTFTGTPAVGTAYYCYS